MQATLLNLHNSVNGTIERSHVVWASVSEPSGSQSSSEESRSVGLHKWELLPGLDDPFSTSWILQLRCRQSNSKERQNYFLCEMAESAGKSISLLSKIRPIRYTPGDTWYWLFRDPALPYVDPGGVRTPAASRQITTLRN